LLIFTDYFSGSERHQTPLAYLDFQIGRHKVIQGLPYRRVTLFSARYYQSGWGQVAIPALPKFFRKLPGKLHERSLERLRKEKKRSVKKSSEKPQLNSEQSAIVEEVQLDGAFYPALIFGITGSGKTEVYLHLMEKVLLEQRTK